MEPRDLSKKCPPDEELSAYMDGDLEAPRQREIEVHLESCELCQQAIQELDDITASLAALGSEKPPDVLWSRIADTQKAAVTQSWTIRIQEWWAQQWRVPVMAAQTEYIQGAPKAQVICSAVGPDRCAPDESGTRPSVDM